MEDVLRLGMVAGWGRWMWVLRKGLGMVRGEVLGWNWVVTRGCLDCGTVEFLGNENPNTKKCVVVLWSDVYGLMYLDLS